MCYCDPHIRTPFCHSLACQTQLKHIQGAHMDKQIRQGQLNILNMFLQEVNDKLMERTSWGRNDLKEMLKDTKSELIEKLLVE